jgi:hypothetical protein
LFPKKIGKCKHPEDVEIKRRADEWFKAWEANPKDPSIPLQANSSKCGAIWDPGALPDRCGAIASTNKAGSRAKLSIQNLVDITGLDTPNTSLPSKPPQVGVQDLTGARMQAILEGNAESTRNLYSGGWKKWCIYLRARKRDPYLFREGSRGDLKDEEDILIDFALHMQRLGLSESSIRSALFGVRFHHLTQGELDPLVGRPRLWMLLKAIKKSGPGTRRKYPVTAEMFKHLHRLPRKTPTVQGYVQC